MRHVADHERLPACQLLEPIPNFLRPGNRDRAAQGRDREVRVPILIDDSPQRRQRGADLPSAERLGREHCPITVRMGQRPHQLIVERQAGWTLDRPPAADARPAGAGIHSVAEVAPVHG